MMLVLFCADRNKNCGNLTSLVRYEAGNKFCLFVKTNIYHDSLNGLNV